MNQHLKNILNFVEQDKSLFPREKDAVLESIKNADKELEITAIALKAQKRELEIESSLERVRTVATGMNQADDLLNICEILFHELQKLEFGELRNALINILDDKKGSFLNYDFSDEMGKSTTTVLYSAHPFIAKQLKQVRSARNAFSETILTGKELKEWIEARKGNGEKDDPRLENAESLYYYFYSIGTGAIGISTLNSIGKTKLDLLKRFTNIFSLSYQRYIDITKAEAQAREAQIEAALERVRSRTMGMQKSEELADVATLLFRQVNDLGIKTWTTGFNIWNDDNSAYEDWIASPGGGFIEPYVIDATAFSEFRKLSAAKKSGTEFFVLCQEGETLKETYKQLSRFATKNQFEKILEEGFEFPSRQFVHMVFGSATASRKA